MQKQPEDNSQKYIHQNQNNHNYALNQNSNNQNNGNIVNNKQLRQQEQNQKVIRQAIQRNSLKKARMIGIFMIVFQIIICINQSIYINNKDYLQIFSTLTPIQIIKPLILSFSCTLGLGLLFCYPKHLIFTSLGYSFFITAFSIQFYPLVNILFTSGNFFNDSLTDTTTQYRVFTIVQLKNITQNNNSLEMCFKAAMSIIVAVSMVLGRVGLTQVWFITVVGLIGFQLNKRVVFNKFIQDPIGSVYVFVYGAFMGIVISLCLRMKQNGIRSTVINNKRYTSTQFNATLALLGSIILMITLPLFAIQYHNVQQYNIYLSYTPTLSLILSSAQGLFGAIIVSLLTRQEILIRDFIHGPLSGIIFTGISSYFTTNLAISVTGGLISGAIQSISHNTIQKQFSTKHQVISTISFTLFGIQGLLSCVYGVIAKAILLGGSQVLVYIETDNKREIMLAAGVVSAAIGVAFGIVLGVLYYFIHTRCDQMYFNDNIQWKHSKLLDKDYQPSLHAPTIKSEKDGSINIDFDDLDMPY